MRKALGLLLLSPFILILLLCQLLWLPFILVLGVVAFPFAAGVSLYVGDSVTDILEPLISAAFAPIEFIKSMLEM